MVVHVRQQQHTLLNAHVYPVLADHHVKLSTHVQVEMVLNVLTVVLVNQYQHLHMISHVHVQRDSLEVIAKE